MQERDSPIALSLVLRSVDAVRKTRALLELLVTFTRARPFLTMAKSTPALVGGGALFALALRLPGPVYLRGTCVVYLAPSDEPSTCQRCADRRWD